MLIVNKNLFTKKTFKITSTKTDWSRFVEELDNNYSSFLTSDYELLQPSKKYDHLNFKKSNPVPWWDSEYEKIKH